MSEVISSFRSLRAGSQVFALLMFISLSDFAYYVFGQESAVAMHLALWYVLLVCHQYDVCENSVGSVYDGGYGGLSKSSSQTTSRDAKPTQHIEITHPNNANLKLAFHKVASFHLHYLTFTSQTYNHPVHRFRSWPMQTTSQSHPHTQVRVQPRNTYNHTYTKFLPGQNKTTSY